MGLVHAFTVYLTSLPMQRCCPTPFSHLWCRLILQALQRRPCFAVFPARNTTCLAVVPAAQTQGKIGNRFKPVTSGKRDKWFPHGLLQIIHRNGQEINLVRLFHCDWSLSWHVLRPSGKMTGGMFLHGQNIATAATYLRELQYSVRSDYIYLYEIKINIKM